MHFRALDWIVGISFEPDFFNMARPPSHLFLVWPVGPSPYEVAFGGSNPFLLLFLSMSLMLVALLIKLCYHSIWKKRKGFNSLPPRKKLCRHRYSLVIQYSRWVHKEDVTGPLLRAHYHAETRTTVPSGLVTRAYPWGEYTCCHHPRCKAMLLCFSLNFSYWCLPFSLLEKKKEKKEPFLNSKIRREWTLAFWRLLYTIMLMTNIFLNMSRLMANTYTLVFTYVIKKPKTIYVLLINGFERKSFFFLCWKDLESSNEMVKMGLETLLPHDMHFNRFALCNSADTHEDLLKLDKEAKGLPDCSLVPCHF